MNGLNVMIATDIRATGDKNLRIFLPVFVLTRNCQAAIDAVSGISNTGISIRARPVRIPALSVMLNTALKRSIRSDFKINVSGK